MATSFMLTAAAKNKVLGLLDLYTMTANNVLSADVMYSCIKTLAGAHNALNAGEYFKAHALILDWAGMYNKSRNQSTRGKVEVFTRELLTRRHRPVWATVKIDAEFFRMPALPQRFVPCA